MKKGLKLVSTLLLRFLFLSHILYCKKEHITNLVRIHSLSVDLEASEAALQYIQRFEYNAAINAMDNQHNAGATFITSAIFGPIYSPAQHLSYCRVLTKTTGSGLT
jgi:hypothetical protein